MRYPSKEIMYKKLKDLKDNNPEISDEYYELTKKLSDLLDDKLIIGYLREGEEDYSEICEDVIFKFQNPSIIIHLPQVYENKKIKLNFSIHKNKKTNKNEIHYNFKNNNDFLTGTAEFEGEKLPDLIESLFYGIEFWENKS
jgi:hypothetical protein